MVHDVLVQHIQEMARATGLVSLTLFLNIQGGTSMYQGNDETEVCGPSQLCQDWVPIWTAWHDNYYEICDPQTDKFILNNMAPMKEIGYIEDECSGMNCWFSIIAALRVVQAAFILFVSFLLPPVFTIERVDNWRAISTDLDEAVAKQHRFSTYLSTDNPEFFDLVLTKEKRIESLNTFKASLTEEILIKAKPILGWNPSAENNEILFKSIREAIDGMGALDPIQKKFLLDIAMPCFYDPKDKVKIFGVCLADVHPFSASFSEDKALLWVGERLKQPALKFSIPMPWSQRVQIGLFWATAATLLCTMSSMLVMSRTSPWRLVLQSRWPLLLRASLILPIVSVFLRMTLWVYQFQHLAGDFFSCSPRVGPFDRKRDVACSVVVVVFVLGSAPQLVPFLPFVCSLVYVWVTKTRNMPSRSFPSEEQDGLTSRPLIGDEEMDLESTPQEARGKPVGLTRCEWIATAAGICSSGLVFFYIKAIAEKRLTDTFLCTHSKVDILKFTWNPESFTGFFITLVFVAFLSAALIGVLVMLRGSAIIDKMVPSESFLVLWAHLSSIRHPPWHPEQGDASQTTREAYEKMKDAARKLKEDRAAAQEAAARAKLRDGDSLRDLAAFKDKESIVLAAIEEDGQALEYASEELQGKESIVLAAIEQDGVALEFASKELKGKESIVLAAIEKDGRALEFASVELQGKESIVLAAIEQDGQALEFASKELRSKESIVLAAIEQDGQALEFASEELQGKESIVLAAIEQNGVALEFASKELQGKESIVLDAIEQNGGALEFASEELQGKESIVLLAIVQDWRALEFASRELRSKESMVLAAIERDGRALEFASMELRSKESIVLAAIEKDGRALEFASEKLQGKESIVLAARRARERH